MSDAMDLEAFVSETILQIVKGVAKAKDRVADVDHTTVINPALAHATHSNSERIEFDVALTVRHSKKGPSDAGITLAVFSADGESTQALGRESVSRVKFAVPIALPATPKAQYPGGRTRQTRADDD